MPPDPILDYIERNTGQIASILGSLAIIAAAVIWMRKSTLRFLLFFWRRFTFQSDMRKMLELSHQERVTFQEKYNKDSERWNMSADQILENNRMLAELNGLVRNGISHKLALQSAQSHLMMQTEQRPIFLCDENGKNLLVSAGYLNLLGIHSRADLEDVQWQTVIYGELREAYLRDFDLAKDSCGHFRGTVDLRNPYTEEHRGRWRVIAPCAAVNAALVFIGRFVPVDDTARRIAAEHDWDTD